MAQVVRDPQLRARIDRYLDHLIKEWKALPALAAEWDEWDDLSQLTFVVNWGVPADRLHELERWVEQGVLTPEQRKRYDLLMGLVAQHQGLLERLLKD